MGTIALNVEYVINETITQDTTLNFDKCRYVAICNVIECQYSDESEFGEVINEKTTLKVRKETVRCVQCKKENHFFYLSDFAYGERLVLYDTGKICVYETQ